MKFCYFHLMPWTEMTEPDQDWPVANHRFAPERATKLYQDYLDTMVFAEDCGFDWIGCNEHHMSPYGLMSNCNLIGATLIQRTRRVRIAMFGNLVPLLNPIRVAEEYAMLDVMSGGRLIAGFMRGIPHEYVAYNVAPSESWERLDEASELILRAWTEPAPFGWQGTHYRYRAVSIWPRPVQQPHPPILMSASNPESARFAARHQAKMGMVMLTDLDAARHCIDVYRETAHSHGWEPTRDDILVGAHTCVAETDEEARRHLGEGLGYFYHVLFGGPRTAQRLVLQKTRFYQDETNRRGLGSRLSALREATIEQRIDKGMVLCGTPDTVIDQIRSLHGRLGYGVMNINMKIGNVPNDVVRRSMELWGTDVAPVVRDL